MVFSDRLTVIFGELSEVERICCDFPEEALVVNPSDIETSADNYLEGIESLENLEQSISDIKGKTAANENRIAEQEKIIDTHKSEISQNYEDFHLFPDDIEQKAVEIANKLPDDDTIKSFEKKITEMREQVDILKRATKNYKILISMLLFVTLSIFLAFGFAAERLSKYSLVLSILSLIFTFTIIILLNLHRDRVDTLRDIQEGIDEEAQKFDNLLLDKIKLEGGSTEILHTSGAESLTEFMEKMTAYKKLCMEIDNTREKLESIKEESSAIGWLKEEIRTKFERILKSCDIEVDSKILPEEHVIIFLDEFRAFSKFIFQDLDFEDRDLVKEKLDMKILDRLILSFRIFYAKAANTGDNSFPVLLKDIFSNFDRERFREIFEFVLGLASSGGYKILLATRLEEHYSLIVDMLEAGESEYQEAVEGELKVLALH